MGSADCNECWVGLDSLLSCSDGECATISDEGVHVGSCCGNGVVKGDNCLRVDAAHGDLEVCVLDVSIVFECVNGLEMSKYVDKCDAFLGHNSAIIKPFLGPFMSNEHPAL